MTLHARGYNTEDPIVRAENEAFAELARLLYPDSFCRNAVADLMRSTPRVVDWIFECRRPVHKYALAQMQALYDELMRLDREISYETREVVLVKRAGVPHGEVSTKVISMPRKQNRWPWDKCMPGDWFFVPGWIGGHKNVLTQCRRHNDAAGVEMWDCQRLLGGTRVDRLPV